jgi:DNA polymerase IV
VGGGEGVSLSAGWGDAGIDHRGEGLNTLTRPEATILHVDMDAFYAAVEVLEDPTLAGLPLIVGGAGRRGVVAAASYEARAYGIRSAMPSAQARRLCPHAVFVAGHHDRYSDYSRRIHEIFGCYTPLVQGVALDEAFLDVTGGRRLFGMALEIGREIRGRIAGEVGLSASVGIATTMFVAKLASEAAKPKASLSGVIPGPGVVLVAPGEELAFLHPKPVRELWGVGPATAARLDRLGVATIGDLARVPQAALEAAVGVAAGRHLHDLAWGRDGRTVEPNQDVKSVGHEETYTYDRYEHADLHREVVRMADAVATRLRTAGLAGRTVTLKVRFGDFVTITRSQTVPDPLNNGPTIAAVGAALLAQVNIAGGVRLLGVSVSGLSKGAARQLSLNLDSSSAAVERSNGPGPDSAWEEATHAVDLVRRRFGPGALGPAALLGDKGLSFKRSGDQQWGPDA